jgi:hypothetical protein
MKNSNILIMSVTMMDLVTSLLILCYPYPLIVARMGIFYQLFPHAYTGGVLMLLSVLFALYGLTLPSYKRWRFIFFMPQQFFLLLTTGSALNYIFMQHYADGVIRSWQFILQDQLPTIILTMGYGFAILDFTKNKKYY